MTLAIFFTFSKGFEVFEAHFLTTMFLIKIFLIKNHALWVNVGVWRQFIGEWDWVGVYIGLLGVGTNILWVSGVRKSE